MERLYRIEELCTTGWELVDEKYVDMTKERTKEVLDQLIADGYNPNTLRAVPNPQPQNFIPSDN
jgi:hypothetical protein